MRHYDRTPQNPRLVGKREKPKFEVLEFISLGLIVLIAFMAGVAFAVRLLDGGMH